MDAYVSSSYERFTVKKEWDAKRYRKLRKCRYSRIRRWCTRSSARLQNGKYTL